MKKILAFMVALFTFVLMSGPLTGTAEAAYVAVVPIDIDVDKVERSGDLNGYYWDLVIDKFQYPDYELLDDEKVSAVLPEEGLKSFDKASLAELADKTGAQVVVAMRVSEVKEEPKSFLREPAVLCHMKGELATYNLLTEKYYYKKINYDEQIEEVLTVRNDWLQNAFADYLRRGLNRTIENKKKEKSRF